MPISRSGFLAQGALAAAALAPLRAGAADYQLREVVSRPYDLETPLEYFRSYITPTPAFFIRSHFGAPRNAPAPGAYRLQVGGEVDRPLALSLADLKKMPKTTVTAYMQCAGNGRSFYRPRPAGGQWKWGAVGNATWGGVRVSEILKRAGARSAGAHLASEPMDDPLLPQTPSFKRSIPLAKANDDSTLLVYEMNGEPISVEHGGPIRLLVPGWAGDNSVKWLRTLTLQADEQHGFWMDTAYRYPDALGAPGAPFPADKMHHVTTMPVKSIIANPLAGDALTAGKVTVQGVAFTSDAEIVKVDVSSDAGATWVPAELGSDRAKYSWRLFQHEFTLRPGYYTFAARATDSNGATQPLVQQWNQSGYFWNVVHTVGAEVKA